MLGMRRSPSLTSHSCHESNVVRSLSGYEARLALIDIRGVVYDRRNSERMRLPKEGPRSMPFSCDHTVYQVRLELVRHACRAVHAVAHEADASTLQPLDRGDAYVLSRASGHNLVFGQRNEELPAHLVSARLAAAIASAGLE